MGALVDAGFAQIIGNQIANNAPTTTGGPAQATPAASPQAASNNNPSPQPSAVAGNSFSTPEQIDQIYQAMLGRNADASGAAFYSNQNPEQIRQSISGSPEFAQTRAGFTYTRSGPSAADISETFKGLANQGRAEKDRMLTSGWTDMLGTYNKAPTAIAPISAPTPAPSAQARSPIEAPSDLPNYRVQAGFADAREINDAYNEVFGRDADPGGLKNYLKQAISKTDVLNQLYASPEFLDKFGGISFDGQGPTLAQINKVYEDVLGRRADPEGLQFYDNSNDSLEAIQSQLLGSDEYRTKAPAPQSGQSQQPTTQVPSQPVQQTNPQAAQPTQPTQPIWVRGADGGWTQQGTGQTQTSAPTPTNAPAPTQFGGVQYDGQGPTLEQINALYMQILGRPADPGGLSFYDQTNKDLERLRQELMNSPEAKGR